MPIKYNKKLRALADASALAECAVPVFVTDDELHTCMISSGARKLSMPITVGKDLTNFFSDDDAARLSTLERGTLFAKLSRGIEYSNVIVVADTVDGERYRAIIVEPQIMFCRTPTPWYIDEAFDTLHSSVSEMISSPKVGIKRLDWYCKSLIRLCTFTEEFSDTVLHSMCDSSKICHNLELIMQESASALASIGGVMEYTRLGDIPFKTTATPKQVYIITSTLLVALTLISSNGIVKTVCRTEMCDDGFMEVSLSTIPDSSVTLPVNDIDELIRGVSYLRPELAAVKDMTTHLNYSLDCRSGGDTLTVSFRIPADATGVIRFRAPSDANRIRIRKLLASLCESAVLGGWKRNVSSISQKN